MRVVLAPMAGVTDKPFRQMVRLFGNHPIYTEMIGVESLYRHHPTTHKMMAIQDEKNIIVQLVGVNLEAFAYATKLATDMGAIGIDINMGCPVKKLISNGSGAALLKNPKLALQIAEVVRANTSLPVSVKMRLGWDDSDFSALILAPKMEQIGINQITIHARTKEQEFSGVANWGKVKKIKENVKIPLFINGDIVDLKSCDMALKLSGTDGAMIGRGAMGKPWILNEIETGIKPSFDLADLMIRHLDLLMEHYGRKGLYIARKHMAWYAKGQKNVADFCQRVYAETQVENVKKMIYLFLKGE